MYVLFVHIQEEVWRVPQIYGFLIIELYHEINKNRKVTFALFHIVSTSNYMPDFIA